MDQYNLLSNTHFLKGTKRPVVMLKVVGASWEKTRLTTIMLVVVMIIAVFAIFFYEVPMEENDGNYSATVLWTSDTGFKEVYWGQNNNPSDIKQGVGRAYYKPNMVKSGWSTLEIQTQGEYPDWVQAYAAGLLEGSLCWQLIAWHWQNTVATICKGREWFCENIREHLEKNSEYVRKQAAENDETSPYWHQINLFYTQLDGLEDGWRNGVARSRKDGVINIPKIDFLWMNSGSDLKDLEHYYNASRKIDRNKLITSIALLKYEPNASHEFLLAHEAAGFYSEMLRLHKRYDFAYHMTSKLNSPLVPGRSLIFTSYPAALYSRDDFYQITGDIKFTVTGVAITIFNKSLWNETLLHEKVLMAPRVLAANRLSIDGDEWGQTLAYKNSGTGNKQWLVITGSNQDEQQKNLTTPLTVWLIEQIPSLTIIKNKTDVFREQGYWINVGLPYYEHVQTLAGYKSEMNQDAIHRTNLLKPIVNILENGTKYVNDINALAALMRHPHLTAAGRSDIVLINITKKNGDSNEQSGRVVSDSGFTIHYNYNGKWNYNKKLLNSNINQVSDNGYQDILKGLLDDRGSNVRSLENRLKWEQINNKLITDNNEFIKEYIGIIDLKVAQGHDRYLGLAGPPFNPFIEPFRWSTSFLRTIPHYGQVDLWSFEPVQPIWVW